MHSCYQPPKQIALRERLPCLCLTSVHLAMLFPATEVTRALVRIVERCRLMLRWAPVPRAVASAGKSLEEIEIGGGIAFPVMCVVREACAAAGANAQARRHIHLRLFVRKNEWRVPFPDRQLSRGAA